jgi:hypothetical protein
LLKLIHLFPRLLAGCDLYLFPVEERIR